MSMYEMQWERDQAKCPECGHAWERHTWTTPSMKGPSEPTCLGACGCQEHARQAEEEKARA